MFSKALSSGWLKCDRLAMDNTPFPNNKFWTLPNQFADDNFKFGEKGRKFSSRRIENTVGKGEIARYEQFLLFPQCFQKTFTADM